MKLLCRLGWHTWLAPKWGEALNRYCKHCGKQQILIFYGNGETRWLSERPYKGETDD